MTEYCELCGRVSATAQDDPDGVGECCQDNTILLRLRATRKTLTTFLDLNDLSPDVVKERMAAEAMKVLYAQALASGGWERGVDPKPIAAKAWAMADAMVQTKGQQ